MIERYKKIRAEKQAELIKAKEKSNILLVISLEKQIKSLDDMIDKLNVCKEDIEALENINLWALVRDEEKKAFQNLIEEYNMDKIENHLLSNVFNMFYPMLSISMDKLNFFHNYDIIRLISFLKSCKGNDFEIRGTVSNPNDEEILGQEKKITIANDVLMHYFELWLTTVLEESQDGTYQYEFDWDFKDNLKKFDKYGNFEGYHSFYKEPYTDEEVKTILKYEKKENSKAILFTKNQQLGSYVNSFYKCNASEVFKAYPITTQYAFIYDVLASRKLVPKMEYATNTEKYRKIRDYLKSYYKLKKKE